MATKTVSESRTTLAQIMTPNDANVLGKVFGGSILAMIDLTASATAQKYSGYISVTASFDRVDFHQPIDVGSLVEMEGYVGFVGRTSMEITIDVYATKLTDGTRRHSNTARVTMVALHEGKPIEVPKLVCETREEKLRYLEGKLRRELRNHLLRELDEHYAKFDAMSDAALEELMQSPSLAVQLEIVAPR